MGHRRWLAVGLIGAMVLLGCSLPTLVVAHPKASLYVVGGQVELLAPGSVGWKPATSCLVLDQGHALRTGADGEALVSLSGGGKLFLDTSSELVLRALTFSEEGQSAPIYNLALTQGATYVDSPGQSNGAVVVGLSSGVVGLYQGTGWLQKDGTSLGIDLVTGSAMLVQVGVMTDTPLVRVVAIPARTSVMMAGASTPIATSPVVLDAVTLLLATGPEAYQRLSSAGSLKGAVQQLAKEATTDTALASRLISLGIPLPTGSMDDFPSTELALLNLEGTPTAEWPSLMASSEVWSEAQAQHLEAPDPPSLVQQADVLPSSALPPGGTTPGQQEDKEKGKSEERPACGRDAANPPARGAKSSQNGKTGELPDVALSNKNEAAQGKGRNGEAGNGERGKSATVLLQKPSKSPQVEARGKSSEARDNKGNGTSIGTDKGKGNAQGQDKGGKPDSTDARGQGQDKGGKPDSTGTSGQGQGQGQDKGGKPDSTDTSGQGQGQGQGQDKGGKPDSTDTSGQGQGQGQGQDKGGKPDSTDTSGQGQDVTKGRGNSTGDGQAADSTPTPEPTSTPKTQGVGGGNQNSRQGGAGGGQEGSQGNSGGQGGGQGSGGGQGNSNKPPADPTPTTVPPTPTSVPPTPTSTPASTSQSTATTPGQGAGGGQGGSQGNSGGQGGGQGGGGGQGNSNKPPTDPTPTPVPPTATPVPSIPTPVPPTATPVPSIPTPVPPTATPVPSIPTPVPPTATPVPSIPTPVPPTPTPPGQSGGGGQGGGGSQGGSGGGKKGN